MIPTQPGLAEVYELPSLGQVGHQGPEVHQPLPKGFLRTGAGFDPLQPDVGALRRVVYNFDRETAKTAFRAQLKRGVLFKTDAQRSPRDRWQPLCIIPKRKYPNGPCQGKEGGDSLNPA